MKPLRERIPIAVSFDTFVNMVRSLRSGARRPAERNPHGPFLGWPMLRTLQCRLVPRKQALSVSCLCPCPRGSVSGHSALEAVFLERQIRSCLSKETDGNDTANATVFRPLR